MPKFLHKTFLILTYDPWYSKQSHYLKSFLASPSPMVLSLDNHQAALSASICVWLHRQRVVDCLGQLSKIQWFLQPAYYTLGQQLLDLHFQGIAGHNHHLDGRIFFL